MPLGSRNALTLFWSTGRLSLFLVFFILPKWSTGSHLAETEHWVPIELTAFAAFGHCDCHFVMEVPCWFCAGGGRGVLGLELWVWSPRLAPETERTCALSFWDFRCSRGS